MTEIHAARDEANKFARLIANYVSSGLDVPPELVDDYRQARGAVDRLVDEANPAARAMAEGAFWSELVQLPDPEPLHACPGATRCLHESHRDRVATS